MNISLSRTNDNKKLWPTTHKHRKVNQMFMNDLSMLAIIRDNPNYAKQLEKRVKEVKQDKANLLTAAAKIAQEHAAEIEEGTRKRQLLITEGKKRGLSETEVLTSYGRFLPTKWTPILNLLYFILREEAPPAFEELRKEFFEKFGHEYDGLNKEQLEEKYGQEEHTEPVDENVEDTPTMETFIYGNMTHKTYQTIKKLKRLSPDSSNEHEAFLAYRCCMKLCEKFSLDFDKVKV